MTGISVIGVGRMGSAIALALSRAGFHIDRLVYRSSPPQREFTRRFDIAPEVVAIDKIEPFHSRFVIFATSDETLAQAALAVAPLAAPGTICLHLSGSISSKVLAPLADAGCECGSMHPLVSVSDGVLGADAFAGAFFCVEGTPAAVSAAEDLATKLGGSTFSVLSELKPLYHAAAVMASGHVTALFASACETLAECGLSPSRAREVLLPLLQSTTNNLVRQPAERALTGPFTRGDHAAVERHIESFGRSGSRGNERIYLELGLAALRLAGSGGLDREAAEKIERAILLALRRS